MTVNRPIRMLLLGALLAGCSPTPGDGGTDEGGPADLTFPWDAENNGKEDAFGRSLVGVPDPYQPDQELLEDPEAADASLRSNMRLRRQVAWESAYRALEPVPLLGLANQVGALPDCPDGVETRAIDKCERQDGEDACLNYESGGHNICAWDADTEACAATCDNLRLPDGQEVPKIPRFSTWYGVEDVNRIFQNAYLLLDEDERRARRGFTDPEIGEAMMLNNTAVERSSRWPLRRYTSKVDELFGCDLEQGPDESEEDFAQRCAQARQSQFSGGSSAGGGIARMVYSPAMVLHMMRNYAEVLECRDDKLADTWCGDGEPCEDPPENFSTCFRSEFPADAGNPWAEEEGTVAGLGEAGGTVLIKATWSRVGFGFELPAYDTDAEALENLVGEGGLALWGDGGDRTYGPPEEGEDAEDAFPTGDDIYTIETRSGGKYRLTGLHIMTKELRHWQWITLWWSDKPQSDFGADRPESFGELPGVWSNYKMCVVVDYEESDEQMLQRFEDLPSLQAALEATGSSQAGAPTWCSNPYIEEGAGNARSNCIGCHQHAGTRFDEAGDTFDLEAIIDDESLEIDATNRYPGNGRVRRRTHFATDYSWAFSRMDDLTELIRTEVEFHGAQDDQWRRIRDLISAEGDPTAGEEVFRNASESQTCTDCHGENGEGDFGPAFEQRFAQRTDWQLMNTILNGRNAMPAWGDVLTDQELTDLFAYLRATFSND